VVGVEYDAVHAAAAGGDRRGERVADQAGTKMIGQTPADQPPGVQVYDGGQVQPASASGQ
jgi:hypothetical protein